MKAHGERLFTGIENVTGRFIFDIASVHEIEHPFRKCEYALFTRISPTKALVLGWWKRSNNYHQHLMQAIGGREIDFAQERQRFSLGQEAISEGQEPDSFS